MTNNKTNKIDFSNETYAAAGVSIHAQNKVNSAVAKKLKDLGMKADGLFGGAADVSKFKGKSKIYLDITGATMQNLCTIVDDGYATTRKALPASPATPIGALDYIASAEMDERVADFVEGVATKALENKFTVLGGESAQMKNTYQEGKMDAFVHVLSLSNQHNGIEISNLINQMERPLVVGSTDGTGTKTKMIRNPEDIIYHGFNDIGAQGVKPIAFALYIAGNTSMDELKSIDEKAEAISKQLGVKKLASMVLVKEDIYLPGEVDIAGTIVGVIDHKDLITGKDVKPRHAVIGIQVDGFMTNGYTLVRNLGEKLIESGEIASWESAVDYLGGRSLLQEITLPHRPMTDILFGSEGVEGVLSKYDVKGMAHITGGGQPDNMIRMVPNDCKVVVKKNVLEVPSLMRLFREKGLSEEELDTTFNMGVGFTLTVPQEQASSIVNYINENFKNNISGVSRVAAQIGTIEAKTDYEPKFVFAN